MDVADFLLKYLELVSGSDQVVKHVPNLGLIEQFVKVVAVFNFAAENKLKLGICDLTIM
jgi:hypothetical protein